MEYIKLNIRGISYSQTQVGAYALVLEEELGDRKLPIIIGNFEAQAIAIALESDIKPPRPLTHDLFVKFAEAFQVKVLSVQIYKLEDGVFYSNIVGEDRDGQQVEIDSRTSDAIALAVRFNAPIYVLKSVMDKAGIQLDMMSLEEEQSVKSALEEIEETLAQPLEPSQKQDWSGKSIQEIKKMMQQAVKNEDYELAARLRDELEKRELGE